MKPGYVCVAAAALSVGVLMVGTDGRAQEGGPSHVGVTQDWTQHSIVFSRDGLARHQEAIDREPRILFQAVQRWKSSDSNIFRGVPEAEPVSSTSSTQQRDWNVPLGTGRIAPNMYPAKYSFDPSLPPDCTHDYVVFGLNTAGTTGGQANLVAFNNLYAGTGGLCGANPSVMFAYNTTTVTGGKIITSPVLSADANATKIAFVESTGTSAIFHVLTWTAGQGAIKTAAAPTMTSLSYAGANNSSSSPWVDYASDSAYVGADNGVVYKINGVFRGTPTPAGAPWPITVSKNFHLTAPVLDSVLGKLMVGSANGRLYQVDIVTGAVISLVVGKQGQKGAGIVGYPVVDVTNGTTFVVSGNDGTSGVLVEADTATLNQLSKVRIGLAGASGTAINLYQPAFSNNYYVSPSNGLIRVCGTGAADTTPWQYAFGFVGTTMRTTISFSQQLLLSTAARCTGWTEFFNPNVNGGTDFFFFGLTRDCTGTGTPGCVVARSSNTTLTTANVAGGPSGIVVDNYSTAGQASSIYFSGASVNTAYKLTQNGLQ